ncbi:MAG: hypothetical protein K1Y02_14640 [Candidatus Hydrogenedentes bacterium]|nr:hypothetical protein [Candidatus Hydrogenedentota bacterium]
MFVISLCRHGGIPVAALWLICSAFAETIPLEHLDMESRNGFKLLSGIEGNPVLGDMLGGPERDIAWVRSLFRHSDAEEAVQSSTNATDSSQSFVTVVDGSGKEAFRFTDPGLPSFSWSNFVTLNGLPRALTLATMSQLRRYAFSSDNVNVEAIPFPERANIVDVGQSDKGRQSYVVLINVNAVWTGTGRDETLQWTRYDLPDSFYSASLRQTSLNSEKPEYYLLLCRVCVDVDGDGTDEVLIPGPDALHIGRWKQENTLAFERVPVPEAWQPKSVRWMQWHNPWKGETDHIRASSRTIAPYTILGGVGPNSYLPGGLCLNRSCSQKGYDVLPLVEHDGQLQFDEGRMRYVPSDCFVNKNLPLMDTAGMEWLSKSFRETWSSVLMNDESTWRIDIDGDGHRDYLHMEPHFSSAGPMAEVEYAIANATTKWDTGSSETGEIRKFRQSTWLEPNNGSLLDFNGDGALDLMFCEPELNVLDIAQSIEGPAPVKLRYTIWLFDKERRSFDPSRKSSFIITNMFHPTDGRRMSMYGPRRWTAWDVDFGDMNGDGLPDAVFMLNKDKLGLCINAGDPNRPFDPESLISLALEPFETYFVPDTGTRSLVVCLHRKDERQITFSVAAYAP